VYKAVLRETGQDVAIKVQRPNITPIVMRDLYIFRALATLINPIAQVRQLHSRLFPALADAPPADARSSCTSGSHHNGQCIVVERSQHTKPRTWGSRHQSALQKRLGCNAALIIDEFGEKLLEECDYQLEATNIQDFYNNFRGDPYVKIPWVRQDLTGTTTLVMEWIDGIRCTDPAAIHACPTIEVQARCSHTVSAQSSAPSFQMSNFAQARCFFQRI
jgi:predicted unusual protein kinase regulating ubiquinone biosynthesis (AarF/ABC1/UbiB family)